MYIHFIINPISGTGKHEITKEILRKFFPEDRVEVEFSEYKKHAILLTQEAILENPDIVVACGGDGTINEVASCLVGTKIKLGIIPIGSGNGLASNLKISCILEEAIRSIKVGKTVTIDVGKANDHYFFSNIGLGIDALIIKKYEATKKRTLSGYINASLQASSQFKAPKAIVSCDGNATEIDPFLLFISNSNQMGYGFSLTPKAKLSDGFLNLLCVPKLNLFKKLLFGYFVLAKKTEEFSRSKQQLVQNLNIEFPDKIFTDIQIDGEFYNLKTNKIAVSILPNALEILAL